MPVREDNVQVLPRGETILMQTELLQKSRIFNVERLKHETQAGHPMGAGTLPGCRKEPESRAQVVGTSISSSFVECARKIP